MTLVNHQKEKALAYLRSKLLPDILAEVYAHREDAIWVERQHFGLGLAVRNSLREGGFEEDDQTLDHEWSALVVAAAEQAQGDQT